MKRILLILAIILSTAIYSQGQPRTGTLPDDGIVRAYPNPATTSITFDLQKGSDKGYSLVIYSFLRRKMYETANLNPHTPIDLTEFSRGVYIYQLYDRSGKMIEAGKFQVSK